MTFSEVLHKKVNFIMYYIFNETLLIKLNFNDILFICEFKFQQLYVGNLVTEISEFFFNVNFNCYEQYSLKFTFTFFLNNHLNAVMINEMRLSCLIITLTDFNDI